MLNSIKLKLVLLFLLVFSIFFTGIEVFLYHELDVVVLRLADNHLRSEVGALANLLAIEEKHGQIETELQELSASASDVYADKLSGHYYQIVSVEGEVLSRSPSLMLADAELPVLKGTPSADFRTVTGPNGEDLRMMTQSFEYSAGPLIFQAADSLEETYVLVSAFRSIVLTVFPAVFVISVAGLFILTGWALTPIKVFSRKLGTITEENLDERIEERGVPSELKPLASSFNLMVSRLEGSFAKQKQFLSDASHELRTPTTIIKSFCDVTLGRERSNDDYKNAISKISTTVNRMCDIINRILVISRLDSKTISFKPVRVDLKDILCDVIRLIEPAAANKRVKVKFHGSSITVRGDREGLTEVLTNVVENAVKYNKDGGHVDVSLVQENGQAVVTVADTGIGIPEEERERIFDRFYRVDASRGVTIGSGLGLSIVRSIVEEHGGNIEVGGTFGEGSTFTVTLPLNHDFRHND